MQFNKTYEEIKDFDNRLGKMNIDEYVSLKPYIHQKITQVPTLIDTINSLTNQIKSSDITDMRLRNKAYESIRIVENKINSNKAELSQMINEITDKERAFFDRPTIR